MPSQKTILYIFYYRPFFKHFCNIFAGWGLSSVLAGILWIFDCFVILVRLQAGDNLVFAVKPLSEVYELAPLGAERRKACLFGLFVSRCFYDFSANRASAFHGFAGRFSDSVAGPDVSSVCRVHRISEEHSPGQAISKVPSFLAEQGISYYQANIILANRLVVAVYGISFCLLFDVILVSKIYLPRSCRSIGRALAGRQLEQCLG